MLNKNLIKQQVKSRKNYKFCRNFIICGFLVSNCLVSQATDIKSLSQSRRYSALKRQSLLRLRQENLIFFESIKLAQNDYVSELEQSVHQQINQYRQSINLPPLQLNSLISEQARMHSQDMAEGKVPLSHEGFEQRAKAIENSIDYSRVAENVAYNQGYSDPVTQAVQGWIDSPGHRQNIEGNYNLTGIGVVKNDRGEYYFTQIFVLQR
ncbi:SCP-like extracellular [Stanieria cyanosphaera PCC 7437]|uniref:SCP-like extracellular n=1 Tax=Stanieria cyanosphaera (strain ATCC 29371 / PCC 7437) TaxID=111780 RepID=K9XVB0_STAC7|nr:SCP-like extracellular [Stanieria cyanosphaera PCC 7437]